jgi:hypothetical protein
MNTQAQKNPQFPHLSADTGDAMYLTTAERIEFCRQDKWIGYTRAEWVLNKLDELLIYPRTMRMPSILVVGRGGNGKSAILERFLNRCPGQVTASGDPVMPVLSFDMPETPDEGELWSTILWQLGISHREKDPPHLKKREVKSALQYAQVRILVIDEFNNLQNMGKRAADILAAIKGISNDLKLSIVAAGTSEAINALNTDPQMKNRFEPLALPRWPLNADYLRFLASYETLLPLAKPSNLISRPIGMKIYGMCGDTLGATVKLLKNAGAYAIENGIEQITEEVLDSVKWTGPEGWDEVARTI